MEQYGKGEINFAETYHEMSLASTEVQPQFSHMNLNTVLAKSLLYQDTSYCA